MAEAYNLEVVIPLFLEKINKIEVNVWHVKYLGL